MMQHYINQFTEMAGGIKVILTAITGITFAAGGGVIIDGHTNVNILVFIGGIGLLMSGVWFLATRLTKGSEQMRQMSEQIQRLQGMNDKISDLKLEISKLKQAAQQQDSDNSRKK